MNFLIADTFTASFNRLSGVDQKAVKASVFDLQMDRTGPGLQLHRIDNSKDPNFWSARVNRDVRLIVHRTDESLLVAYVDHHDAAYAWAERRRIEAHPRTGAIQIVDLYHARQHRFHGWKSSTPTIGAASFSTATLPPATTVTTRQPNVSWSPSCVKSFLFPTAKSQSPSVCTR